MSTASVTTPLVQTPPTGAMKLLASPWLWLVAVWLFLHGAALFNAVSPVVNGLLPGPDSYMRLVRIEVLLNGGDWFSGLIARSNAPDGEILHWTRLFDMIVLGFSAPLVAFMPMKEALFWGGAFSSPFLHLALGWAVLRAAQTFDPLRRLAPAAIVAIGVLVQPAVFNYSLPGRSDHHTLLFLLFALVVWQMLAVLRSNKDDAALGSAPDPARDPARNSARHGAWAGLAGAVGIWASPELFSVIAIAAIGLGFGWLFGRNQSAMLRANLWFAGTFLVALVPLTLIEHGLTGFLTAKYDQISIVSVFAAAAIFAGWVMITLAQRVLPGGWVWRLLASVTGGIVAGAAIYLVFPGFFVGSMAEVDPRIVGFWLSKVQEMRPIDPATAKGLAEFVNFLGLALIALPALIWTFWRQPETRLMTAAATTGLILMVAASILHSRFSPYAEVIAGIGLVGLVARLLALREAARSLLAKTVVPIAGILAVFIFPFIAGNALNPESAAQTKTASAASASGCNIRLMSAWLTKRYRTPVTILAMLDRGPALLWFTRHRVIATPYHRNHPGILAIRQVLSATDDAAAKAVATRRQVDLLLLCPNASETAFAAGNGSTLYKRLATGEGPAWLAPIDLPAVLQAFRLYAIRR